MIILYKRRMQRRVRETKSDHQRNQTKWRLQKVCVLRVTCNGRQRLQALVAHVRCRSIRVQTAQG